VDVAADRRASQDAVGLTEAGQRAGRGELLEDHFEHRGVVHRPP